MVIATGGPDAQNSLPFDGYDGDPTRHVKDRLRWSGYPFLWRVRCELCAGVLVLTGWVPTDHLKQMAQELAQHTSGVGQVENRLQVTSSARWVPQSAAAAG